MSIKIAHLADLHIRGLSRHKEYQLAFEDLYTKLRSLSPDLITIVGDIWHTKCQSISPEGIEVITSLFQELADIAPLHITLGNHDGILSNSDRQDVISPLVSAMGNPNIHLYKKSGVYPTGIEGFDWCVYSCFDEKNWKKIKSKKDRVSIGLFHGPIRGCKYDNGSVDSRCDTTIDFFKGCSFVFLGDLHENQNLAFRKTEEVSKAWIAYPGSFLQQNYGESLEKGFLFWTIISEDDFDIEFIPIENRQPFYTIDWKDDVKTTLTQVESPYKLGSRYRIKVKDSTVNQLQIAHLKNELKDVCGAEQTSVVFDTINKIDTIETNGEQIKKIDLKNDVDSLLNLFNEYKTVNLIKTEIDDEKIKTLLKSYTQKLNEEFSEETIRNVSWSLKKLEFDNIFKYSENNVINFDKLGGIIGVFGKNRAGKSTLITALTYGLFNTTDRGAMSSLNVINRQKKSCLAKIDFSIGGKDYLVERQTLKQIKKNKDSTAEEKSTSQLNFFEIQGDNRVDKSGEKPSDTEKEIRKLIGTSKDFFMTAFSPQFGVNKFIEEGPTQRKSILSRFLELDIFEKLFEYAKEDYKLIDNKFKKYSQINWDKLILSKSEERFLLEEAVENIKNKILDIMIIIDDLKIKIAKQCEDVISVTKNDIDGFESTIHRINTELTRENEQTIKLTNSVLEKNKRINEIDSSLEGVSINELKTKLLSQQKLQESLQNMERDYTQQLNNLSVLEKSILKLSQVPCGEQFTGCKYIKDSYRDKISLPDQKATIKSQLIQITEAKEQFRLVKQDNLGELINSFTELIREKNDLGREIVNLNSQILRSNNSKPLMREMLEREKEKYLSAKQKYDSANDTKFSILVENKKRLDTLKNEVKTLENQKLNSVYKIGALQSEIEKIQQEKIEYDVLSEELKIYDLITNAFSKTGIPAIVLKAQLPAINAELGKILQGISDFSVELDVDTSTNSMDIFIEDEHSKRVIELASGAEKTICSLALRVALTNLSSLAKPDIFIIDEGFGSLDDDSLLSVIEFLKSLKAHFKTILVISHINLIKEAADTIIEVTSDGQNSKIEMFSKDDAKSNN